MLHRAPRWADLLSLDCSLQLLPAAPSASPHSSGQPKFVDAPACSTAQQCIFHGVPACRCPETYFCLQAALKGRDKAGAAAWFIAPLPRHFLLPPLLAGGMEEYEAVQELVAQLPPSGWVTSETRLLNRPAAPILLLVWKRG